MEVMQASAKGMGAEKIEQKQLKAAIPRHITEEVPIYVVHASGRVPLAGYKDGTVFHVVWIDRKFKLYDHG